MAAYEITAKVRMNFRWHFIFWLIKTLAALRMNKPAWSLYGWLMKDAEDNSRKYYSVNISKSPKGGYFLCR